MNLVELRQALKTYHTRLDAFHLAENLNQNSAVSFAEIEENAEDLFSASTVEFLHDLVKASADATETERDARRNLLNISRLGFLKNQTKEISSELENCQKAVGVKFQNENLNPSAALKKIESLPKAAERLEIFRRLFEAKNRCSDLLNEKSVLLREKTGTLGFEGRRSLFEEISRVDFDDCARRAVYFLERTEEKYFRLLSVITRKFGFQEKTRHAADLPSLQKNLNREEIYEARNLRRLYSKILENFNFSEYKIPNIKVKIISADLKTRVFRSAPPNEVRFCIAARDGAANYIEFMRTFGKANLAAWTSKELLNRYPEFVFSPEDVLPKAYGFLFQTLLAEDLFLRKTLNIWDEKMSDNIRSDNEFRILFEIRREALRFVLETQVSREDRDFDDACAGFAETFSNHLGFRFDKRQLHWEISEKFSSLENLRAVLFAFGLREYFREKHGFDWWQNRKSFEELIDFWNSSQRYRAEEMAKMVGFEMSFDLVADTL